MITRRHYRSMCRFLFLSLSPVHEVNVIVEVHMFGLF